MGNVHRHFVARAALATTVIVGTVTPLLAHGDSEREISSTSEPPAASDGMAAAVEAWLRNDRELKERSLRARSSEGVVTLEGTVKSRYEEEKAVGIARRVEGVRAVASAIEIVP